MRDACISVQSFHSNKLLAMNSLDILLHRKIKTAKISHSVSYIILSICFLAVQQMHFLVREQNQSLN